MCSHCCEKPCNLSVLTVMVSSLLASTQHCLSWSRSFSLSTSCSRWVASSFSSIYRNFSSTACWRFVKKNVNHQRWHDIWVWPKDIANLNSQSCKLKHSETYILLPFFSDQWLFYVITIWPLHKFCRYLEKLGSCVGSLRWVAVPAELNHHGPDVTHLCFLYSLKASMCLKRI